MPANSNGNLPPLDTPGTRIKFLRQAKSLTQETLARMVFTTQPTVARWEADEFLPSRASQHLIAQALGAEHAFVFGQVAA